MTIRPRSAERTEERRARAHHHAGRTRTNHIPLVEALARGKARMEHRHRVAETRAEATNSLRRERDLGHEHTGRATMCQNALDGGRYTSVLPEPVTPSTKTTSAGRASVARAIASRAFCCPAVSSLGADAFAEESVVEPSHPRQLRRSSTVTTPRFSSERIVADRSPFMRLSSRVVTGPQESASMSWRWRTARSAGSNDRPSSVRLTQRTVTEVTVGGSYAYEPSSRRTTLPAPPGGSNRRRHSESGAGVFRGSSKTRARQRRQRTPGRQRPREQA